jgi:hypothetical protein
MYHKSLFTAKTEARLRALSDSPFTAEEYEAGKKREEEPTMPALRIDRWIDRLRRGEPNALELDRRRPSFIAATDDISP